jgi:hypothetical protein
MVPGALPLALVLLAAPAETKATLPPTPPDVSARMNGLFAKATPAVRAWVDAEARKLRPLPPPDAMLLQADARQGFPAAQPPLTPGQADVLAAMAVYQVVNDLDSEARLAPNADALAKLAERKGAFLKLLSTLVRKISDTDAAIVGNLK